MESFVGDVGMEVLSQKLIQMSLFLASVMIFLITFISIILSLLFGNRVFTFPPCITKLVVIK